MSYLTIPEVVTGHHNSSSGLGSTRLSGEMVHIPMTPDLCFASLGQPDQVTVDEMRQLVQLVGPNDQDVREDLTECSLRPHQTDRKVSPSPRSSKQCQLLAIAPLLVGLVGVSFLTPARNG